MPDLPLMVYDGECDFCKQWVEYGRRWTGDRVAYAPSQEVAGDFPQIPPENFQASVQLILPNGQVFSGAQAVFRALAHAPGKGWPLWLYERVPGLAPISEAAYRFVAARRPFFYRLTRFF